MKHFVHRPYNPAETIAAVATPPGEGGVAIIRISGKDALSISQKVFSGNVHNYQTHTAHFGKFLRTDQEILDEGLLLVMLGGRSYTGEDTVELHCHGGSLVTKKVLHAVLSAGARAAEPGEFTFRAFMNGKIDLAQAEAVQSLIAAKNELALSSAKNQLQGRLSKQIASFQAELIDTAAILEAWVDFPEEGLEFASLEELLQLLSRTRSKMATLSDTFHHGKIMHEGLTLCLAGAPNVGKSSLMNAMLGKERAIVTDIAGTTRDLLEDYLRLGGLHFRLLDTAGIRETEEVIEKEGIKRTAEAMKEADIILLVVDASKTLEPDDQQLIALANPKKTLLVWNKIDQGTHAIQDTPLLSVKISAKAHTGLNGLQVAIEHFVWQKGMPSQDEVVITNFRHKQALNTAIEACDRLIFGLKEELSPELLSIEMRTMLSELGSIIGMDITEEILTSIFSKFCVGK
jgi:tRNA modification GTPase